MTRRLPSPGSWYRVPLNFRVVDLPPGCACCGTWEGPGVPIARDSLRAARPSLCAACEGHVGEWDRVLGILAATGILAGTATAMAAGPRLGEEMGALAGFSVSVLPIMLQPWLLGTIPLASNHGGRASPWKWRRTGEGRGELVTGSGRLAAWVSVRNALVPDPIPGPGAERTGTLSLGSGSGAWLALRLAYWQLALVLLRRGWGSS